MLLALLLACTGTEPPADSAAGDPAPLGDPATVALGGACPLATRFGGFEVSVGELYSTVSGSVADGVVPITVLAEAARDGECVLLRRDNPYCDPTCDAAEACDFDGTCIPYPENQDLGTVDVLGLEADVAMEPVVPGNTYFDTTVPHPVVEADAFVELRTEGGPFGPLTLHGVGPEPLVLDTAEVVVGADGLDLAWAPPAGLGRASVELRLTVDQHGLTPLTLACDFADDGAGEVPAALLEELLTSGVSGWPNGRLSRRTVDSVAAGEGCADLRVGAEVELDVSVDGHTPCDGHDDCPSGQHCNFALETCE